MISVPKKLNVDARNVAMKMDRVQVSVQGDKSTYTPGQRCYIDLPSSPSDLKGSFLSFNADITTPGAASTYDRFTFPIGSVIERLRVLVGSEPIEVIDNYQLLHGAMSNLYSGDLITGQALAALNMEGSFVPATRATQSIVDKTYTIKLFADSLRQFWALDKLNQQFRIELTFAQPAACLESDGTAPSYTVSNVLYSYDQVTLPKFINDKIDAEIRAGTYEILFHPFQNFTDTSLGASTRGDLSIPARYRIVSKVLSIIRENASVSDLTVDYKTTKYDSNINNITSLALKVNNQYIPSDRTPQLAQDANKDHDILLRRFFDAFEDISGAKKRGYNAIAATSWKAASYQVLAFDLRTNPQRSDLKDNGVRLNEAGAQCRLQFDLSAGYTAAVVDTFVNFEECVKVRPGGMVEISY